MLMGPRTFRAMSSRFIYNTVLFTALGFNTGVLFGIYTSLLTTYSNKQSQWAKEEEAGKRIIGEISG